MTEEKIKQAKKMEEEKKIENKKKEVVETLKEKTEKVVEKEISKKESPKVEKTVKKVAKKKVKKYEARVNANNVQVGTKQSVAICKFIKGKRIENAIEDLEMVSKLKKAIPMKGEIPHRKGVGMMSGRYPVRAVGSFIKLLQSLDANSTFNEIENPVIVTAIPNLASRPFARGGSRRKKRTHITLVAKEFKEAPKNKMEAKK